MMNNNRMLICLIMLFLVGCVKENIIPTGKNLGHVEVGCQAGEFPVAVNTEGYWTVKSLCEWISVDSGYRKGDGAFSVRYEGNESFEWVCRFNRRGNVLVKTYDGAVVDTIEVWQKGIDPFIQFENEYVIGAEPSECTVSMITNLNDEERSRINCASDVPWILDPKWGRDGRSVVFSVTAGHSRSGHITFTHIDQWGVTTSKTFTVAQL